MKRSAALMLCLGLLVMPLSGCFTLNHTIGNGGQATSEVASDKQWFALWGLVPLNNVDGGQLAKSKGLTTNYTVQSQMTFIDCLLSFFTSIVTVECQTVKVLGSGGGSPSAAQPAANSPDYLSAGNQMMAGKDYKTAIQYYQAAVSVDPNSIAAYQGMGTCYYYLGQKAEALNAYQKALALNPSNTQLSEFIKTLK